MTEEQKSEEQDWTQLKERGSTRALRLLQTLYHLFGRRFCVFLVFLIAIYLYSTSRISRWASRRYFDHLVRSPEGRAALGHSPTWRDSFRHCHEFGIAMFDRTCVWIDRTASFQFKWHGDEHLRELVENKKGGILLGSHLGSFEMLRTLATQNDVVINIVMFSEHASMVSDFYAQSDPDSQLHIISLVPNSMQTGFEIRSCLERGELVAMLADRVPPGYTDGTVEANFLGAPVLFPKGPFQIAALLGCPVLLTTGLRIADASYEIFAEPFYDGTRVPRAERDKAVGEMVQRYAERLEQYCYRAPYQWFNMLDYWRELPEIKA